MAFNAAQRNSVKVSIGEAVGVVGALLPDELIQVRTSGCQLPAARLSSFWPTPDLYQTLVGVSEIDTPLVQIRQPSTVKRFHVGGVVVGSLARHVVLTCTALPSRREPSRQRP